MKPISVQLYSLRDASADNFDEVLKRLADIGYLGVEPFNLFGKSPKEFTIEEARRYVICDCGRTGNSPFCDGTHSKI